jgi:N-methylhydantoinase A/oxoprolinase/acetone carboxylase beta subunit
MAPLSFEVSRSAPGVPETIGWPTIESIWKELELETRRQVRAAGATDSEITVTRSVDLRLEGQSHELNVTIPEPEEETGLATIARAFSETYLRSFGRLPLHRSIHAVTWRARATAPVPGGPLTRALASRPDAVGPATTGARPAYFPEVGAFVPAAVIRRNTLAPGDSMEGPVIVEEEATSTVVGPRARLEVLEGGSLRVLLR